VGSCGLNSSGSVWGPATVCYEYVYETSGSVKGGEFLY